MKGGSDKCAVASTVAWLKQLCHRKLQLRHDNEPAMKEFAEKVRVAAGLENITVKLDPVPPYSHASNGNAEKQVDIIQKQARALRFDLEIRSGLKLHPGMACWPWLVRHAAWTLAR